MIYIRLFIALAFISIVPSASALTLTPRTTTLVPTIPISTTNINTLSGTSRGVTPTVVGRTTLPKTTTPVVPKDMETLKVTPSMNSKRAFVIPFTQKNLFNARAGVSIGKSYTYKEFVYCPGKDPLSGIFGNISGSDIPSNPFGGIFGNPESSTTSSSTDTSASQKQALPPQCSNGEIGYNINKSGTANMADSVRIDSIHTNFNPNAVISMTLIASPNIAKNPPSQFKEVYKGNSGKSQITLPYPPPSVFYRVEDGYWYAYFTKSIAYVTDGKKIEPSSELPWIGVSIYTPPVE